MRNKLKSPGQCATNLAMLARIKWFRCNFTQAQHYATDHIVMTMGSDFQYNSAVVWFKNMDKLIKYVNAEQANGTNINLVQTLSHYIQLETIP